MLTHGHAACSVIHIRAGPETRPYERNPLIIIDTNKLAPAEAVTNSQGRKRRAATILQARTTQLGEETTYVELIVSHGRGAKAYYAELRHHIDLVKPNNRRSILVKVGGIPSVTFMEIPTGRYSEAKLDGLYEQAYARFLELVELRNEKVIALLTQG